MHCLKSSKQTFPVPWLIQIECDDRAALGPVLEI